MQEEGKELNNMNKRLTITGLLMVAPFLMANSPAPFAQTDTYDEVSISDISQTGNTISFDLTNNGDKYICSGDTMTPIYGLCFSLIHVQVVIVFQ